MDRVGEDVSIAILEKDVDHGEIVNVIKMTSDFFCREFSVGASDDKIATCSACDLV